MMYVLHDGHFPISFACSSGVWPGSGELSKCFCGECVRSWCYFYDHELHVPLSTCALPFCTQSVKSELQLAHRQEVQTVISDKPTYHIQDVHGSSLKSVLHQGLEGNSGDEEDPWEDMQTTLTQSEARQRLREGWEQFQENISTA